MPMLKTPTRKRTVHSFINYRVIMLIEYPVYESLLNTIEIIISAVPYHHHFTVTVFILNLLNVHVKCICCLLYEKGLAPTNSHKVPWGKLNFEKVPRALGSSRCCVAMLWLQGNAIVWRQHRSPRTHYSPLNLMCPSI